MKVRERLGKSIDADASNDSSTYGRALSLCCPMRGAALYNSVLPSQRHVLAGWSLSEATLKPSPACFATSLNMLRFLAAASEDCSS